MDTVVCPACGAHAHYEPTGEKSFSTRYEIEEMAHRCTEMQDNKSSKVVCSILDAAVLEQHRLCTGH